MNRYAVNYSSETLIVLKSVASCHHDSEISQEKTIPDSLAGTGSRGSWTGSNLSEAIQDLCDCRHEFCKVQRQVWELNSILNYIGKRLSIHFLCFKHLCS